MSQSAEPRFRPDGHPVVIVPSSRYFARLHWRLRKRLPMWTVYGPCTAEYPGVWVARMFVTLPQARPTRFVLTHHSLHELRAVLPPGLVMLSRSLDDAPEIVEVWL